MSRNILKSLQDNGSIINNEQSYLPNHPVTLGLPPELRKYYRGTVIYFWNTFPGQMKGKVCVTIITAIELCLCSFAYQIEI